MTEKNHQLSQTEQMVRGTAWLTAGNILSRLLGAIYIIPWYAWMGQHGAEANALFGMGYNIYALFLLVSTVGIPVAIAKQVAKYNTLDQREMSFYLIRQVLGLMFALGMVFALIMYFGSPFFATMSGGGEELIPVMQSLTLAVLVFPAMSVLRGFFQGFNNLKPYGLSQISEQIVRVIWMLVTAFFIMKLGSKDYVSAVVQSTFAAFVGMLASFMTLIYFLWKEDMLGHILKPNLSHQTVQTKELLLETVKEAIPFIVIGSAIQIFQIIDQMTFINSMTWFTDYSKEELTVMFAYFSANPGKLTMILIGVALSIGGAGIPLLTETFIKQDKKAMASLVINNLQMVLLYILPAVVGASILAKPLYTIFYGLPDRLAWELFILALLQTALLALYSVISPMLQALFENRLAMRYFAYGLILKLVIQIPLIYLFQARGPILATSLALLLPIVLMYRRIQQVTGFNHDLIKRTSLLFLGMTLIMEILVAVASVLLSAVLPVTDRWTSLVHLVILGGLGILVYGFLALMTKMLDKLIGKKAQTLRDKLGL